VDHIIDDDVDSRPGEGGDTLIHARQQLEAAGPDPNLDDRATSVNRLPAVLLSGDPPRRLAVDQKKVLAARWIGPIGNLEEPGRHAR
jgi:hypothetical protein